MKPRGDFAQRIFPYAGAIALLWFVSGMTPYSNTIRFLSPQYYWGLRCPDAGAMGAFFTVAMGLLGIAQIWPKLRKWSMILAIAICIVPFFWGYPQPYLYLPSISFGVLQLVTRIRMRMGYAVLGLLITSFFGLLSFGYINLAFAGPDQIFVAYVVAFMAIAAALFFANGSRKLLLVLPVVTLLFAVSYLGSVIREIRQNQDVRVGLDGWSQQANVLRAKADIR
jgi:thiamine transporter ThiT